MSTGLGTKTPGTRLERATASAQFAATFKKYFITHIRDIRFILGSYLLPIMLITLCIVLTKKIANPSTKAEIISYDPIEGHIPNPIIAPAGLTGAPADLVKHILDLAPGFAPFQLFDSRDNASNYLTDSLKNKTEFGGGLDFTNATINATYASFNIIVNTTVDMQDVSLGLVVYNALFNLITSQNVKFTEFLHPLEASISESFVFLLFGPFLVEYAFAFIAPVYSIQIIIEKEKKLKEYLMMNSLRRWVFWLAAALGDFIFYAIIATIGLIALAIARIPFMSDNNVAGVILLFITFAFAQIPFGYLFSFAFQKEETANKWLFTVFSFSVLIPYIVMTVAFQGRGGPPTPVQYLLGLFPPYGFSRGLTLLSQATFLDGGWTFAQMMDPKNEFIGYLIIFLVDSVVFSTLVLCLDYGVFARWCCKTKDGELLDDDVAEDQDEDVVEENARLRAMDLGAPSPFGVAVHDIRKHFVVKGTIKKVLRGVSFETGEGELFGLLGPNGAGKTTLLSILTAQLRASSGEAVLAGHLMTDGGNSKAFQNMGFCPQHDILYDALTAREHLHIFAQMKGVLAEDRDEHVNYLLKNFALDEYADEKVKGYSGGTKRKLSTALALVGDPAVVFLDEPSAGMDPGTRRVMWDMLMQLKEGRVMILTTHYMEEAEALCTRIGIVVDGRLRCLGTSSHLRNKYGNGYRITLKVSETTDTQVVEEWLSEMYPMGTLASQMNGTLAYEIPQESTQLSQVFTALEEKRVEFGITDYSVSQTTLEQVFLRFAQIQNDKDEAERAAQREAEEFDKKKKKCCK